MVIMQNCPHDLDETNYVIRIVIIKTETETALLGENRTETEMSVLTGSRSVLTCRNGLTEDVADSLNDVLLNHFWSAEQCERDDCQSAVGGRTPHVGKRPLSASLKPAVRANKSHFLTTI